jgi:hypothetical protein
MARHTLWEDQASDIRISRICNYLKCRTQGVKPVQSSQSRTISGAVGLRPIRDDPAR